ncbi:MAG: hypothetical protein RL326_1250 [Pseudomonadota bacterium]|jgi:hypothetical protein
MLPIIDDVMKVVHSRTQAEWSTYFQERLDSFREYLRAHGEQGALLGFVMGIFIVLFFKLSLFIFILAVLAYLSVQMLAPKE